MAGVLMLFLLLPVIRDTSRVRCRAREYWRDGDYGWAVSGIGLYVLGCCIVFYFTHAGWSLSPLTWVVLP